MLLTITAVFLKNRENVKRAYPWSFMLSRIFEGVFSICVPFVIYYFIFEKNVSDVFQSYAKTSDYITYIVLGESVYVVAFATLMNVGRCMILEIREGTLDIFILSPASRMGYFLGAYLEQILRSLFEFGIVVLIGLILGAEIRISQLPLLIIMLFTISLSCFSCAMLLSSVMVFTRDTYLTQNTLFTIIGLVSGALFPTQILPHGLQILGSLIPLTHGLTAFRNCILRGESILQNISPLLIMLGLSVIYAVVGFAFLRKLEYKLIENIYS